MRKNQNTNRGITLIALIITIIVLLMLAGVALATLTGDSGILSNAEKAKEQTKYANAKEQVALAVQGALTEGLGTISYRNLVAELDKLVGVGNYTITPENEEGPWTVTVIGSGYSTVISGTGKTTDEDDTGNDGNEEESNLSVKLTLSHENTTLKVEELANVSVVTNENVPIPEGFYHVEGTTKNTGLVISSIDGDDLDNTKKGNQFVWVPVNQKQKLTLEVTSKEEITEIVLTMPDGSTSNLTPSGKTHNQEITMTKNGVYAVEVKTASETKTAQKRITSLYAQDIEMIVLYYTNWSKIDAEQTNSRYETAEEFKLANGEGKTIEELATESNLSVGMYMLQNMIFIDELEEEFKEVARSMVGGMYTDNNQNIASVEKYGGFYIARFEAGDGTTGTTRDASSSDANTLVSQRGEYVYNYVDWETAKTLSTGMYSSSSYVTSQLVTGAGWDRTMNWLVETGMDEEKVLYDSRSWGNNYNSTGNAAINSGNSNMNYTTGRSEYWKANNIYDLAGNTWEWTQEQSGPDSVDRGGGFNDGDVFPASDRFDDDPATQYVGISFRTQLYIK